MCIYCVTSINSGFTWNFSTLREAIAFSSFGMEESQLLMAMRWSISASIVGLFKPYFFLSSRPRPRREEFHFPNALLIFKN